MLISICCFILSICLVCILFLFLHIEYATYVILLIYLGGVVIFFLFLTTFLSNEVKTNYTFTDFTWNNWLYLIFYLKFLICLFLWNEHVIEYSLIVSPLDNLAHLSNNIFLTDFFSVNGDIWYLIALFSLELAGILILLGLVLLYAMVGVIVILKEKNA